MASPVEQHLGHLGLFLVTLASSLGVGECISGAAASGAVYALGIGGGGGAQRMRDEEAEALVMLV